MTIAVSVVVNPSRRLLLLVLTLCLGAIAIAAYLAFVKVGERPNWLAVILALVCVALIGVEFAQYIGNRKRYHLDISGVGKIRLRELTNVKDSTKADGILVVLLADSTLWSWLLVLRLQDEGGHVYTLPILPDSLSTEAFRAVSVACRWVAAHRFSIEN